jgi:hypothetical protein
VRLCGRDGAVFAATPVLHLVVLVGDHSPMLIRQRQAWIKAFGEMVHELVLENWLGRYA